MAVAYEKDPNAIPALSSPGVRPAYTSHPRQVLIVEDNLDSIRSLANLVQDMGHIVSYAINGYAALTLGKKQKPDFVLLDIGLPGMDGLELCRQMRADPDFSKTRIFALTAYGDEIHRQQSREAGCELHLLKPVAPQTIFDLLDSKPYRT